MTSGNAVGCKRLVKRKPMNEAREVSFTPTCTKLSEETVSHLPTALTQAIQLMYTPIIKVNVQSKYCIAGYFRVVQISFCAISS